MANQLPPRAAEPGTTHSTRRVAADAETIGVRPVRGLSSLVVLVGGTFGTAIRAALAGAFPVASLGWPWVTFAINLSGSFLLGLLLQTLLRRGPDVGLRRYLRLGLGTGVLGGYTTYSTFGVETVRLLADGAGPAALGYGIGSVVLGLAAAALGIRLAGKSAA